MFRVQFESNKRIEIDKEVHLNSKTIYRMNKHKYEKQRILKSEEMDEESDDVPMRDENEHRDDSDDMSDDELQDRMLKENKERKTKNIDIERMTNR